MQVWVYGDQRVEAACEQITDDALADGFAGMECLILTHVTKIRCDQRQMPGTELQRCCCSQLEFDQFLVGAI